MAGRPSDYDPTYHPVKMVELMEQGYLDCEIHAEFGISKETFYNWKKRYSEFKEAHEVGLPKCEKKTIIDPLKTMIAEGNDKGYKALAHLARNKFGHDQQASTVNTQINFNKIEVIESKTDYFKILEQIKEQAKELNLELPELKALEAPIDAQFDEVPDGRAIRSDKS